MACTWHFFAHRPHRVCLPQTDGQSSVPHWNSMVLHLCLEFIPVREAPALWQKLFTKCWNLHIIRFRIQSRKQWKISSCNLWSNNSNRCLQRITVSYFRSSGRKLFIWLCICLIQQQRNENIRVANKSKMQFKQISSENEWTIRKHESSKKRGETAYVMFIITQPLRPLFFSKNHDLHRSLNWSMLLIILWS